MMMPYMCKKVVVFDLDDTLYKEIDFLKSGYRQVAQLVEKRYALSENEIYNNLLSWYYKKENPFALLNETYGLDCPVADYLDVYRFHHPNICLSDGVEETLSELKPQDVVLGIITDGRKVTQQNKIEALGLGRWFEKENIFINEEPGHFKPSHWSFERLMQHCLEQFPSQDLSFYYVGDNPQKDFLAPNELGWETICLLDDGRNIHQQEFNISTVNIPNYKLFSIRDIIIIIYNE